MAADTAPMIRYRMEFIAGFEQRQSLLRESVTTEIMVDGLTATFLIADSGGDIAVTRGVNGLIPASVDQSTQTTCTLVEWHNLRRKTKFNIFQSQGNQRAIMQMNAIGVMNRKVDQDIITELNTGTVNTGAAVTGSVSLILKAKTILGNSGVPWDSNLYGLITPAMEAFLMQTKEFASVEYINNKPTPEADPAWKDRPVMFRWLGVNWCTHPNLPGKGTNAEKCFLYHKTAIGHAVDTAGIATPIGYDEEQDYSWARATVFMGSKLLQNSGLVVVNHDGSAYVAA
jgi:hypothetical protein